MRSKISGIYKIENKINHKEIHVGSFKTEKEAEDFGKNYKKFESKTLKENKKSPEKTMLHLVK